VEEFRTIANDEGISKLTSVIPGGEHRHESVRRGLEVLPPEVELVAIHDAARPLITPDLITSCLEMAAKEGASALAVPVTDTLHQIDASGCAAGSVDRSTLRAMQTPQVFYAAEIGCHGRGEEGFLGRALRTESQGHLASGCRHGRGPTA
jgi:2-C-methyl-D-erythritol 4-phosphate cytidylyltransferase